MAASHRAHGVRRVALAACLLSVSAAPTHRDWSRFPAVVQIETAHPIYAIGDIHGDYDKAAALLVGAELIRSLPAHPQDVQWTGGHAVLVCTGDLIDKWSQGIEVVQLMRDLQTRAEEAGGRVIVTLGNHEAEFLAAGGDGRKSADFSAELTAAQLDPHAVAAGSDAAGIGAWLRNLPAAAKVNNWFFCHAGNTGGNTIVALEHAIEQGVDQDGFGATVLSQPNSILEARAHPIPWWLAASEDDKTRRHDSDAESAVVERLQAYAKALGCAHIVMGHQPDKIKFDSKEERAAGEPFAYAGVLFLIDTGMSRGVQDGRGIVLKVHAGNKETVTAIGADGKTAVLWSAR